MSRIYADNIDPRNSGDLTVAGIATYNSTGADITGIVTATSFYGDVRPNSLEVSGVTTVSAGSTSAPSITPTGDANTGIFFPSADTIAFGEGGVEAARIDSSGRFGIGTQSPVSPLSVQANDGGEGIEILGRAADGQSELAFYANDGSTQLCRIQARTTELNFRAPQSGQSITFTAGGSSERARIDSSGRLLVGTTTARSNFNSSRNALAQFEGASDDDKRQVAITYGQNGNDGPVFVLAKHRGSVGQSTAVANGDDLGAVFFTGSDGTTFNVGAYVAAAVDGTPGTGDIPSRLEFGTTADGASSPTERMRIDSQGRVGLGTQSPLNTFHILQNGDATSDGISIQAESGDARRLYVGVDNGAGAGVVQTDTHNLHLKAGGSRDVQIYTNGSEKARFTRDGQVLFGTSTVRSDFFNTTTIIPPLQIEGTSNNTAALSVVWNSNSADSSKIYLCKTRGTAVGGTTVVQNDDDIGSINFQASDGSELVQAASIAAAVDGTPGANDMPGRLVFSTTADGASSPTERMRITSGGAISCPPQPSGSDLVGTDACGFVSDGAYAPFYKIRTTLTTTKWAAQFHNGNGQVGSISMSGSATAFTTSSDYRLKENIAPLSGAADRLKQLKPSKFNFKADPTTIVDGFIAHEAQAVVPECVTGTKDEVDADGNPLYQGIDQSKLVPLLTAALQEAIAKIETLETQNTTQATAIADLTARIEALEA
jgi:hypothetical protein